MKKIFNIVIFLTLIITIGLPTGVFSYSFFGTTGGTFPQCQQKWCYSGVGVRFSLYKKDKYIKSIDYDTVSWTSGLSKLNGKIAKIGTKSGKYGAGKVFYQKNGGNNWTTQYYKIETSKWADSSDFPCYLNCRISLSDDKILNSIEEHFKLNDSNPNNVVSAIKSVFGTTINVSDLKNLYLTIEPTLYISSDTESFYGTAYEFMNLPNITKESLYTGLYRVFYSALPMAFYAQKTSAKDPNGFIGGNTSLVYMLSNYNSIFNSEECINYKYTWSSSDGNRCRELIRDDVISNKGYGIGVFWFGENFTITNCDQTCSGYEVNTSGRLECAENYCESNSTTNSSKKQCITSCGYAEPSNLTCSESIPIPTTSTCSETVSSKKTTCSYSNYQKMTCSDTTKVTYSNELPIILPTKLGGFNYSIVSTGNRNCTIQFDNKKFEFDYAALKRNSRSELMSIYNNYKTINSGTKKDYQYKFSNDDTAILNVNNKKYNLIKVNEKTIDSTYSEKREKQITGYGKGLLGKIKTIKEFKSSSSVIYQLPLQCYSLETGKITALRINGLCKTSDLRNKTYYGYYNKSSDEKVNTEVKVVKSSSGLNDTNSCYYKTSDSHSFNCNITVTGSKDLNGYYYGNIKALFNLTNNDNLSLTYNFDGFSGISNKDLKKTKSYSILSNTSKKIKGSVTYNGTVIDCSIEINNIEPPTPSGKTCTKLYKPSEYDSIRNYCNENWYNDTSNYNNATHCYESCTTSEGDEEPGDEFCKNLYSKDQLSEIKSYCMDKNKRKKDGYSSYSMCFSDCSGNNESIKKDYIYRTILINNPFPNRTAGSNWIGYENYIIKENDSDTEYFDKTTLSNDSAEYIIELDSSTIKQIRKNTKDNGGLGKTALQYDGTYKEGIYKSNFIKDFNKNFICVDSSGECE